MTGKKKSNQSKKYEFSKITNLARKTKILQMKLQLNIQQENDFIFIDSA